MSSRWESRTCPGSETPAQAGNVREITSTNPETMKRGYESGAWIGIWQMIVTTISS